MDSPLLRLARLTFGLACYVDDSTNESERMVREAGKLINDLESSPPTTQGRTITREQVAGAVSIMMRSGTSLEEDATYIAKLWGITVEDESLYDVYRAFGVDVSLRDSENMGPTSGEMALAQEVVRLRAALDRVRETASELLGFVIISDKCELRPDAASHVTPLEFHQHTTHAMRELLAALGGTE